MLQHTHSSTLTADNPFLESIPNAIGNSKCGVCHGSNMSKYFECRSLDSGFAPLYSCLDCHAIYNATAEFNELDVVEWQKRWSSDPEFYKVPSGKELQTLIGSASGVFDFFENDLDVKFSGTYMEIGAGSGVMAAAALKYFADSHVFDHVQDRLLQVKEAVGENYHVLSFEQILKIKADVILIWHAMEHLLNPGSVFKICAERLKENGHFLIQVPVLTEEHVYPGHYYFYSEMTFKKLAEVNGLLVHNFYYDHAMNAMTVAFRRPGKSA